MTDSKELRCLLALKALKKLKRLNNLKQAEKKRKDRLLVVDPLLETSTTTHDIEAYLLKDILWENGNDYQNFCRMTIDKFEEILELVEPQIKDTAIRYAITSRVRLAITLRHITSGDSYRSLELLAHISRRIISKFVPEILKAIIEALECKFLKTPTSENEWYMVANDFDFFWQFPHTLGSIDGKHIRIKTPQHSASNNYNLKRSSSIVLLAVVDAHGRFIYIHVGNRGAESDADVLKNSSLYKALESGKLKIPPSRPLKGQETNTSFYFVGGDDIFGVNPNFLQAYNESCKLRTSHRVFNYRFSRARIPVNIAFGRLTSRFRIFRRPIEIALNSCDILVKACCVLHNYLTPKLQKIKSAEKEYHPISLPETIKPLTCQDHKNYKYACKIRDNVCTYCVTDGDIPDQWNKIIKK